MPGAGRGGELYPCGEVPPTMEPSGASTAGAGRKLGPRVARVRRIRLCWELFQCGRLWVGRWSEAGDPHRARVSLSGPGPALRHTCPAFGCCTLSLEFPSGSFLGSP